MNRTLRGRHNGASAISRFAMLLRSLVSPLAGMTLLTALAGCASTSPSPAATFHVDVAPVAHPQGETPQWWYRNGAAKAAANGAMQGKAKNVIVFLGDGMSLTTVAAARIFEGQRKGAPGEENLLSWEHFPHTAFSKTYNTDSQTPDSAGTMTAIASGVKSHMGAIGVSAGHKGECTPDGSKDLLGWLALADSAGLATGIVTTARITHATPAAMYAHVSHRDWENDTDLPPEATEAGCKDIAQQLLAAARFGHGPTVALGGGRGEFLPVPLLSSVTFGPPLTPADYDDPGAGKERYLVASSRIMARIAELRPPPVRGV